MTPRLRTDAESDMSQSSIDLRRAWGGGAARFAPGRSTARPGDSRRSVREAAGGAGRQQKEVS